MSDRQSILAWSEGGAINDVRAALRVSRVLPDGHDWRAFLDRLLLWSGAIALAAAVVFFIAHNWQTLGKFGKFGLVQLPIIAAVVAYWRLGPHSAAGKASLLVAAILIGALLALFGQTYQTGADTWELFATWAALIAPWVLIGRFAGMWILWIALVDTAIVLYFQVFPGVFGVVFGTERLLWILFAFNTAALVAWELAAARIAWLAERWAPRLLVIASGATITLLMIQCIVDWQRQSGIVLLAYPASLGIAHVVYRLRKCDLLVLAGACLSLIIIVPTYLAKTMAKGDAPGGLLFIAIVVIAMAGASGWWLKHVARET